MSELSTTVFGWYTKGNLQNVSISSEGILTWDAYPGATDYYWQIYNGGGRTWGETSVNLKEFAKTSNYPAGSYTVTLVAAGENGEELTNEWKGTYIYISSQPGDIDRNGVISIFDVRLLLQAYINSSSETIWDSEDLAIMDMDGNGSINIIDVRLLLQEYINQ